MFVSFQHLPSDSRLWIFQAQKKFTDQEITIIDRELQLFTNDWVAHGQPLQASYQILENHFIVLAANESFHQPSGCSIDDSMRTIKHIGKQLGQDLTRRDVAYFKLGDEIVGVKISDLKNAYEQGVWNENTLTFNTLVASKLQLASGWLVPASATWLKRYIKNQEITH